MAEKTHLKTEESLLQSIGGVGVEVIPFTSSTERLKKALDGVVDPKTIFDNSNTKIFMRAPDNETTQMVSDVFSSGKSFSGMCKITEQMSEKDLDASKSVIVDPKGDLTNHQDQLLKDVIEKGQDLAAANNVQSVLRGKFQNSVIFDDNTIPRQVSDLYDQACSPGKATIASQSLAAINLSASDMRKIKAVSGPNPHKNQLNEESLPDLPADSISSIPNSDSPAVIEQVKTVDVKFRSTEENELIKSGSPRASSMHYQGFAGKELVGPMGGLSDIDSVDAINRHIAILAGGAVVKTDTGQEIYVSNEERKNHIAFTGTVRKGKSRYPYAFGPQAVVGWVQDRAGDLIKKVKEIYPNGKPSKYDKEADIIQKAYTVGWAVARRLKDQPNKDSDDFVREFWIDFIAAVKLSTIGSLLPSEFVASLPYPDEGLPGIWGLRSDPVLDSKLVDLPEGTGNIILANADYHLKLEGHGARLCADFVASLPSPDSLTAVDVIKIAVKRYRANLPAAVEGEKRLSLTQTYHQVAQAKGFKCWDAMVAVAAGKQSADPEKTSFSQSFNDCGYQFSYSPKLDGSKWDFNPMTDFVMGSSSDHPHLAVITGHSGAGKTEILRGLALQAKAAGRSVRVLDFGGSYRDIADQKFESWKTPGLCINPFTGVIDPDIDLADIAIIVCVMCFAETEVMTTLAQKAVESAYKIKRNKASFDDVHAYLSLQVDEEWSVRDAARAMADKMVDYTSTGTYGKLFAGPASFNLQAGSLAVADIETLWGKGGGILFEAVRATLFALLIRDFYISTRDAKRLLIVEESAYTLRSTLSSAFKQLIISGYRRAKSHDASIVFSFQSPLDLDIRGLPGDIIGANTKFWFMMPCGTDYRRALDPSLQNKINTDRLLECLEGVEGPGQFLFVGPQGGGIMKLASPRPTYW